MIALRYCPPLATIITTRQEAIADRPTDFNVSLWSGGKLANVIGQ